MGFRLRRQRANPRTLEPPATVHVSFTSFIAGLFPRIHRRGFEIKMSSQHRKLFESLLSDSEEQDDRHGHSPRQRPAAGRRVVPRLQAMNVRNPVEDLLSMSRFDKEAESGVFEPYSRSSSSTILQDVVPDVERIVSLKKSSILYHLQSSLQRHVNKSRDSLNDSRTLTAKTEGNGLMRRQVRTRHN